MLPLWYLVLAALLTVVAFGGNGLVIYLIATKRQLHNTANWIILSLSVADIAVSAGTIATEYVSTFRKTNAFATASCRFPRQSQRRTCVS